MVKVIRNGRIVDEDGPAERRQEAVGGGADLGQLLQRQYFLPEVNQSLPGWALLAAVVAASLLISPVAGVALAALLYYLLFHRQPQQQPPPPPPPPTALRQPPTPNEADRSNTYNSWGGSSMSQTQASGQSPSPQDAERIRRARAAKFATMNDVKADQ